MVHPTSIDTQNNNRGKHTPQVISGGGCRPKTPSLGAKHVSTIQHDANKISERDNAARSCCARLCGTFSAQLT
eukprot:m.1419924 g.1419924  ORF g.1419924 m.1419924 type:complete len:73 (-) comp25043_c0_seq4:302-520(-)